MSVLSSEKRILVTGGAGFLGQAVVRKLRLRGCEQIFIPRRATCDLSKWTDVAKLFAKARPHLVLHLAASDDRPAAGGNPAESFYRNVLASTHVIEAAYQQGVLKLLCVGCESSYSPQAPVPFREETLFTGLPESPRVAYGIAKRLPLIQAQVYRRQYGFRSVFVIPTNLYGPNDNFGSDTPSLIASLIRKLVEAADSSAAPEVVIAGSGSVTRDFLFVDDCADAILLALDRYDAPDALNLGSGSEVGVHEVVRRIAKLAGYTGQVRWDASQPEGPRRRVLDIRRAQGVLGYAPRRQLNDGLSETIDWYRASLRAPAAAEAPKEDTQDAPKGPPRRRVKQSSPSLVSVVGTEEKILVAVQDAADRQAAAKRTVS